VQVLYFAWLCERLNRGSDEIDPPPSVATVGDLMDLPTGGGGLPLALSNRRITRAAVNDANVSYDYLIAGARRFALFPPMTGG
jgi:molybdopterin synthase sulfur carrier subunit